MSKVSGAALGANETAQLMEIEVDDSLFLPAMATLTFDDPWEVNIDNPFQVINGSTFAIGNPITVAFGTASDIVFSGEITSIEPHFGMEGFATLAVRAYDKGHRLLRLTKTRTFLQMKTSDIISTIAGEAGLSADVAGTDTVHDYVVQYNETDYDLVRRLAARAGQVIRCSNGKLTTKAFADYGSTDGPKLNFGNELHEFRPRLTSARQPSTISIRGWDPNAKDTFMGEATNGTLTNEIGAKRGTALAAFGDTGKHTLGLGRLADQGEAQDAANALMTMARNGDIQAEGEAVGNAKLAAATKVEIGGLGSQFDGKYMITRAIHRYTAVNGYHTTIESTNGSAETLYDLLGAPPREAPPMLGPAIGIVTNLNDPDGMGRVKVKMPWMVDGDQVESDWCRIATPMAGNARGVMFHPEVNDEVLVIFEHGDARLPYIVGFLWNGKDKPPLDTGEYGGDAGQIKKRQIKTTSGHTLTFDDTSGAEKISIIDKTKKNKIEIDSSANKITIDSSGEVDVKAAQKVNIEGTTGVTVKGQQVEIKGDSNITVEAGAQLTLKGSAGVKIDGGAMVEIKGGIVKIN